MILTSLNQLRPGDIMFGPITGPGGLAISLGELIVDGGFRMGKLDVRHVGIVVQDADTGNGVPWMVQAMPGGADRVPMLRDRLSSQYAYARMPEDYPGQALDAARIANMMVTYGVGYSWASYLALAAWHWGISTPKLEAWIGRRSRPHEMTPGGWKMVKPDPIEVALPVEAICSVLVDQAWSLTGKKIFEDGRPHQCVTPSQLASRLLSGMPDVQWFWPTGD